MASLLGVIGHGFLSINHVTEEAEDRGGRPANRFRKSQIRKHLRNCKIRVIPQKWQCEDLRFADLIFFEICGLSICTHFLWT
jgi:hypothetical protein